MCVCVCVDFYALWFKSGLELQNTDLFSIHSQHTNGCLLHTFIYVFCVSVGFYLCRLWVRETYLLPKFATKQQQPQQKAKPANIPSRQNGKFYFTNRNWTASQHQQQQSIHLCRNFYLTDSLELRFIFRMKCFPCDVPFYLFYVSFFALYRSLQYTNVKKEMMNIAEKNTNVYKRFSRTTFTLIEPVVKPKWMLHAKEHTISRKRRSRNIFEQFRKRKMKLWF